MEKYKLLEQCVKVLQDFIVDLESHLKQGTKMERNYAGAVDYLFLDKMNKEKLKEEIIGTIDYSLYVEVTDAVICIKKGAIQNYNDMMYTSSASHHSYMYGEILENLRYLCNCLQKEINDHDSKLIEEDKNKFFNNLINACVHLQSNIQYYSPKNENSRNDYIRDLLDVYGYLVKDQSRIGESSSGKDAGEADFIICSSNIVKKIIIEALNYDDSRSKDYVLNHYKKLVDNYDSVGNDINVLLNYVTKSSFIDFCIEYKKIFEEKQDDFEIKSINGIARDDMPPSICIFKSLHEKNGKLLSVYHVLVEMKSKKI